MAAIASACEPASASAAAAASRACSASSSAAAARSEARAAVLAVTSATAEEAMKESYCASSAAEVLPIVTLRSMRDSMPSAPTTAARPWTCEASS